ncbi:MAG: hypothetical protein ICV63_14485, partial [Coleofasciculus sp. Co-bin14]|nr:hypothetical protein [Coleofasciculus sp. Co-bin14]
MKNYNKFLLLARDNLPSTCEIVKANELWSEEVMGLFDQVLGAIANPNQQASPGQIGEILSTVNQLSNNANTDPSTIQSVLSIVGNSARSALQQKRQNEGDQQTQAFINQFGGTNPSTQAVQLLFSTPQIQQIVQEVA